MAPRYLLVIEMECVYRLRFKHINHIASARFRFGECRGEEYVQKAVHNPTWAIDRIRQPVNRADRMVQSRSCFERNISGRANCVEFGDRCWRGKQVGRYSAHAKLCAKASTH